MFGQKYKCFHRFNNSLLSISSVYLAACFKYTPGTSIVTGTAYTKSFWQPRSRLNENCSCYANYCLMKYYENGLKMPIKKKIKNIFFATMATVFNLWTWFCRTLISSLLWVVYWFFSCFLLKHFYIYFISCYLLLLILWLIGILLPTSLAFTISKCTGRAHYKHNRAYAI